MNALPIVGRPSAGSSKLQRYVNARARSDAFRVWGVRRLWQESVKEGLDPVGVVMQACKETGWGGYDGAVPERFHNTCGLRVDADTLTLIERTKRKAPRAVDEVLHTLSHAAFPNWIIGARAHVQHLCAYVGRTPGTTIVDPRYPLLHGAPKVESWRGLSGRWAPSTTYGQEIEDMMRQVKSA